jgi:hypothetical protein
MNRKTMGISLHNVVKVELTDATEGGSHSWRNLAIFYKLDGSSEQTYFCEINLHGVDQDFELETVNSDRCFLFQE